MDSSWIPGLDDLGQSVRRIKESVESISTTIRKGSELLDEATVQMISWIRIDDSSIVFQEHSGLSKW